MSVISAALLPICGGIVFSLALMSVVILAGWSWLWSSGPSKADLYKEFRTYLDGLQPHEVSQVIKAMMAEVQSWKQGGPIAQAARKRFLDACKIALTKVHSNPKAAVNEFMEAMETLFTGLEGLAWLGAYLQLVYDLFTAKAPGALSLLKSLAQIAKRKKLIEIIETIEKIKDPAEKAKKLKELKEELDKIRKKIPEDKRVSLGPRPFPPAATGDFSRLGWNLRALFSSPAAALSGWSPVGYLFGGLALAGCCLLILVVPLFGWRLFGPDREPEIALPAVTEEAAVTVPAQPTEELTPTPAATPTMEPAPSPIDLVLEHGHFTAEERASILTAYLLDPEGDWIYSIAEQVINNPLTQTDIRGHLGTRLDVSEEGAWQLFNQSDFPCNAEIPQGFVFCTEGAEPMPTGEIIMLVMLLDDPVPLSDPDLTYTYAALLDADGNPDNNFRFQPPFNWDYFRDTDRWYTLDYAPGAGGWSLTVTDVASNTWPADSKARAVIMGDIIVFFIPGEEFSADPLGYRMSAFGHDGTFAPNASSGDVTGADPTEPLAEIDPQAIEIDR